MRDRFSSPIVQFVVFTLMIFAFLTAFVLPRQLSRPVLYESAVVVEIDGVRYRELFDAEGSIDADFIALIDQVNRVVVARYPGFGSDELFVAYSQVDMNHVEVVARANNPMQARKVANEFADMLVLTIRAAGGREIIRNLLAWELHNAVNGEPPSDEMSRATREFLRHNVFVFQKPLDLIGSYTKIGDMNRDDQYDLLRAVEYRGIEISELEIPANADAQKNAYLLQMNSTIQQFSESLLDLYPELKFAPSQKSLVWRINEASLPSESNKVNVWVLTSILLICSFFSAYMLMRFNQSVRIYDRLMDLLRYRELVFFLVRTNLIMRYSASVLGFAWSQIMPLSQLLIFWMVFSYIFNTSMKMYLLFIFIGIIAWNTFSESVMASVGTMRYYLGIIRSVYIPREVFVLASVLTSLVNFILGLPILLLLIVLSRYIELGLFGFPLTMVYMPVIIVVQTVLMLGFGLIVAAMSIEWTDSPHFVGILLNLGFFLTPIFYSFQSINPMLARVLRWVNPMSSVVEFYREVMYGTPIAGIPVPGIPATESIARVLLTGLVLCALGYWAFRRVHDLASERAL